LLVMHCQKGNGQRISHAKHVFHNDAHEVWLLVEVNYGSNNFRIKLHHAALGGCGTQTGH